MTAPDIAAAMIDTHCHLNFYQYDADRPDVIQRARDAGVRQVIIPGTDVTTSREALQLAADYDQIFAAVGIHPNETASFDEEQLAQIRSLSQQGGVIAIGEIGLDYHWDKSPKATQAAAFRAQLQLATERQLPVIIHNREASADVLPILEEWVKTLPGTLQGRPGVLHSFSADNDYAKRALDAGFYLGFTGPITFRKADDLRDIARQVPLDRILVETDGPYLTPHPYRGKRNEPAYIPYIVAQLAQLHGLSADEIARRTTENAERLFQLSAK